MMYLSDDLIQLEHFGLGQYAGHNFSTMINPNRIQAIRIKGPRMKTGIDYIDNDKNVKTYQVIYSHKGYTESFLIDEDQYLWLIVLLALKQKGIDYYEQHFADPKMQELEYVATHGKMETYPNGQKIPSYADPRELINYIRKRMEA